MVSAIDYFVQHVCITCFYRCKYIVITSGNELEILCGLDDFQEHLGGELHITIPSPIGSKIEITEMDKNIIRDAIKELKSPVLRK